MKKTYIKPEILVVNLNSFESIMQVSGSESLMGTSYGGYSNESSVEESDAREVIDIPDVWEEW